MMNEATATGRSEAPAGTSDAAQLTSRNDVPDASRNDSSEDSLERNPAPADDPSQEVDPDMPKFILVAEDSPTQREMLRADLGAAGYEVTATSDAQQALQELGQRQFDLLVSDVIMPGMSGYDLCREAKRCDSTLPVVLLTSLSDPLDVVHALQAGADNFLRKPYTPEQLLERIETILYNRQLRQKGQAQMGLELFFLKQRFMITAERQQILDLLVATFEDLVVTNERLRDREEQLARAHDELRRRLGATEAARQKLDGVLAALPGIMLTVDHTGTITGASDGALDFLGAASAQEVHGRGFSSLLPLFTSDGMRVAADQGPVERALRKGETTELGGSFDLLIERPDGFRAPVVLRSAPLRHRSGSVTGAVAVVHELGALAAHDPLTGLPTQSRFAVEVRAAAEAAARHGRCAAVVVLAPDRFQRIRDSLGPAASDALVSTLARRLEEPLQQATRPPLQVTVSAAYLGNQEFAVVVGQMEKDTHAVRVAELVVEALGGSYAAGGVDVPLTLSAGVAVTTSGAAEATDLVPAAAAAARAAAAAGGNRVAVSDPQTSHRAAERLREESDLRLAIQEGHLRVHYQPKLAVSTGDLVGVEALVRWQHPQRGLLRPDAFIPLAEDSGLIVPLGSWVLREACRQMAVWRRDLPRARDWTVSVNLSPQQLGSGDIADIVRMALDDAGLDASALELEITETGVMADPPAAKSQLSAIKNLGACISVDDFGTGFSSLLLLRQFPVDALKIDRAFVGGMTVDDEDAAIVAATVRLGQALGLQVVAEGVETVDQVMRLQVLGCDLAQGYHWAPPLDAGQLLAWAQRRPPSRTRQLHFDALPDTGSDTARGRV